jgi:AcrR family transcriptional regulator
MTHSTPTFYEKQHDEREKSIIAKSKALLLDLGFHNVTMSMIAKETKLSRQRLYCYFKNIDEILYRIETLDMKAFLTYFQEGFLSSSLSPEEKLTFLIKRSFIYQEAHPEDFLFTSEFDLYYRREKSNSILKKQYRNLFNVDPYFERLVALFHEGVETGAFRDDIKPEEATFYWANTLQLTLERISFLELNHEGHSEEEMTSIKENFLTSLLLYIKK